MAILFNENSQIFTLHTANTTYQMKVDKHQVLLHLYYGARIEGNMEYMLRLCVEKGFSGNPYDAGENRSYSLDTLPTEYPSMGTGDFRSSALIVKNADGSECCDLRYVGYQIKKGKYNLKGLPAVYASEQEAETLVIILEDAITKVQAQLLYGVLENADIITRSAVILNRGKDQIIVEKAASTCLDFLHGDYDFISFYGGTCEERWFQRTEIVRANQVIGSRRGTSSHQYNPAVIIADRDATEDAGSCYGMMFVYSGGFMCEAEQGETGTTRALMGLQSDLFHYPLERGESLVVPETILTYSNKGFTELSKRYHHCIKEHICRGKYKTAEKPILINSWEAAYFDFTGEKIYNMAKEAAELGIDMIVMDDGWFGKRDDDNSSLGDWVVNEKKLGGTLGELIDRINGLGMKFGIWIEPEMVSEDSNLYRKHPDWALQIPGRKPIRSRNQLVLDFSRTEIRDTIFDQICTVLDQGNVEYVKWDMNRSIADVYSMDKPQGKVLYDYVLGVYEFAGKLIQRYPHLLIEGCSGGGGRFDAGMLYYTPQIWCSDNTNAISRLKIQYGTSFFYPITTMGSHVAAVPKHGTHSAIDVKTRGIVAMSGTFGYELNPEMLSETEKEDIKKQVQEYRNYAQLIRTGDYYRLSSPFQHTYTAWEFVSESLEEVLFNVVVTERVSRAIYIKLKGLKPDAFYIEEKTGMEYCGAALMEVGIPLGFDVEQYQSYQTRFLMKERELEDK